MPVLCRPHKEYKHTQEERKILTKAGLKPTGHPDTAKCQPKAPKLVEKIIAKPLK